MIRRSERLCRLYLASSNSGKLREFQRAARNFNVTAESVPRIGDLPPCVEDGKTFEANARKKALHYAAFVPGLVFADDSGIVVDALAGAPGVYSARFAGPGASEEQNNQKLIAELRRTTDRFAPAGTGPPGLQVNHARETQAFPWESTGALSSAHYLCVIALAEGKQILHVTEGQADGRIIYPPRGSGGFGYDPYFFYPPLGKTFAQLTAEEKFAVSHRGIAFRKLLEFLRSEAWSAPPFCGRERR